MIPLTGACERPWPIALSRSSRRDRRRRGDRPRRRGCRSGRSAGRRPLPPWRRSRPAARRAGLDITSRARSGSRIGVAEAADEARPRLARRRGRSPTPPAGGRRRRALRPTAPASSSCVRLRDDAEDALCPSRRAATSARQSVSVDDLVREVARCPRRSAARRRRRRAPRRPPRAVCLAASSSAFSSVPLLLRERGVQERRQHLLARAVAEAPCERLGVALGRRRVRQRARVLVDAERERRRLERRDGDLALGEDADERRRQRRRPRRARRSRAAPLGELARVVVEDDLLDAGVERDRLELAEPRGVHRLDDDRAAGSRRARAAPASTQRSSSACRRANSRTLRLSDAREHGRRAGVQAARGEQRRERVEVRVDVRGDDLCGSHRSHCQAAAIVRAASTARRDQPSRSSQPHASAWATPSRAAAPRPGPGRRGRRASGASPARRRRPRSGATPLRRARARRPAASGR